MNKDTMMLAGNRAENRTGWMSPINKLIWMKAFIGKQPEVTLNDGRKFIVDYDRIPGKVWVTPKKKHDFVPCGWFDYKKVTDKGWLDE